MAGDVRCGPSQTETRTISVSHVSRAAPWRLYPQCPPLVAVQLCKARVGREFSAATPQTADTTQREERTTGTFDSARVPSRQQLRVHALTAAVDRRQTALSSKSKFVYASEFERS